VIQFDAMFSQVFQFTLIFKYAAPLMCNCFALPFLVVVVTELALAVLTLMVVNQKTCTEL
jgi:hypothetical protein